LLRYALVKFDVIKKQFSIHVHVCNNNIIIMSDDITRGESGMYGLLCIDHKRETLSIIDGKF
jgi:hypothetical protein